MIFKWRVTFPIGTKTKTKIITQLINLSPLLQMAVRGCAMGKGNASWVRTAGTVSATLGGEGQAAVLPWRPPAMTTRTMKEVRNACWMQKLFLSPLAFYASHLSRLEKKATLMRCRYFGLKSCYFTVVKACSKLIFWCDKRLLNLTNLISFFYFLFFFAENVYIKLTTINFAIPEVEKPICSSIKTIKKKLSISNRSWTAFYIKKTFM